MVRAAYHQLLMVYYTTEKPFPADLNAVFRVIGAVTKAEREATDAALRQFFSIGPDGCWHQKRADEEIAKAHRFIESQRAKGAKRWNPDADDLSRHDDLSSVAKLPKSRIKETLTTKLKERTFSQPPRTLTNANGHPVDAGGNTAADTAAYATAMPTISHKPLIPQNAAAAASAACVRASEAAAAAGVEINPNDPRIVALVADGATPGEFRLAAARATAAGKGVAWFVAAVSGMRRDAAAGNPSSASNAPANGPNYPMLPRSGDPW